MEVYLQYLANVSPSWELIFPKFTIPKSCVICRKKKIPHKQYQSNFFGVYFNVLVPESILKEKWNKFMCPFPIKEWYIPMTKEHIPFYNLKESDIRNALKVFLQLLGITRGYVIGTIQNMLIKRGTFSHPQIRIFEFELYPIEPPNPHFKIDLKRSSREDTLLVLINIMKKFGAHAGYITLFRYKGSNILLAYYQKTKNIEVPWPIIAFRDIGFKVTVNDDGFP